jgi:hypothetical protein
MTLRRNHSIGLRLWHWMDALVVMGLITTFFLRDALVSHSRFLVTNLNAGGIAVSDAAARPTGLRPDRSIAGSYRPALHGQTKSGSRWREETLSHPGAIADF